MPLPIMLIVVLVIMLAPKVKNVLGILVFVIMVSPCPRYKQAPIIVAHAAMFAPLVKNALAGNACARMVPHFPILVLITPTVGHVIIVVVLISIVVIMSAYVQMMVLLFPCSPRALITVDLVGMHVLPTKNVLMESVSVMCLELLSVHLLAPPLIVVHVVIHVVMAKFVKTGPVSVKTVVCWHWVTARCSTLPTVVPVATIVP